MAAGSHWRGHSISELTPEVWVYDDTQEKVSDNKDRPCGYCNKPNHTADHDACLGELPGVMNACCGHGHQSGASIQFLDGYIIGGESADIILNVLKRHGSA